MEDSVDKRNKFKRVSDSIIKWWNVRYISQEELDRRAQEEELKRVQEICDRLEAEASADAAIKAAEVEAVRQQVIDEAMYNATTHSYSGAYGQEQEKDEVTRQQIDKILGERENEFERTLREAKEKTE